MANSVGMFSDARGEYWLSACLGVLALVAGGWALWPALFPAPAAPSVTHAALPPLRATAEAAPSYPTTASITPLISGKLNLNTATEEQLEALPGVGPAFAQRIIQARPLHSLADLDAVKGVGPATLKRLEGKVTF